MTADNSAPIILDDWALLSPQGMWAKVLPRKITGINGTEKIEFIVPEIASFDPVGEIFKMQDGRTFKLGITNKAYETSYPDAYKGTIAEATKSLPR